MKFFVYSFFCFFIIFILCLLIILISYSLVNSFKDKGSPFECGFQVFGGSSFSFSLPFFIISLMFLLFDVEVLLVCFYPLVFSFSFYSLFTMGVVLFSIFGATMYEWSKGIFSWV